jgi:hypothetical protein
MFSITDPLEPSKADVFCNLLPGPCPRLALIEIIWWFCYCDIEVDGDAELRLAVYQVYLEAARDD